MTDLMEMRSVIEGVGKAGGFALDALVAISVSFKQALEKAEEKGYERGFAEGRRAAIAEMKNKLFGAEDESIGPSTTISANAFSDEQEAYAADSARAPRGSVAPAVLEALGTTDRGLTPREVAEFANIPENSARGSLNKLRHQKLVAKNGPLWVLFQKKAADSLDRESAANSPREGLFPPQ